MSAYLYILFVHWVSDFIFQNRWMANNKSKYFLPLIVHVCVYIVVFWFMLAFTFYWTLESITVFCSINFILHWITDAITSRVSTAFHKERNLYAFFATIGLDQFVHQLCLLVTTENILKVYK